MEFLSQNKDAFAALQSIATILALAVGGIWTYLLFVKKRLKYPKAVLSHRTETLIKKDDAIVLRNTILVKNIGETRINLTEGFTRIQLISPHEDFMIDGVLHDIVLEPQADSYEIGWPMLQEVRLDSDGIEIEPGEHEEIICDHNILKDSELVTIYTYLKNKKKRKWNPFSKRDQIGWSTTSTYKVK